MLHRTGSKGGGGNGRNEGRTLDNRGSTTIPTVSMMVLVLGSILAVRTLAGADFVAAAQSGLRSRHPSTAAVQAMASVFCAADVRFEPLDIHVRAVAVVFYAGVLVQPARIISKAVVVNAAAVALFELRSTFAQVLVIGGSDGSGGRVVVAGAFDDTAGVRCQARSSLRFQYLGRDACYCHSKPGVVAALRSRRHVSVVYYVLHDAVLVRTRDESRIF